MEEVKKWLMSLELGKYCSAFEECGYDNMPSISSLTESEVDKMINDVGCKIFSGFKIKFNLKKQQKGEIPQVFEDQQEEEISKEYKKEDNERKW
jgi:hypothetical protein